MLQELVVPYTPYGTDDELKSNIRSALARGLPEIQPAICSHDGTLVIAGSGPSLPDTLDALVAESELGRPVLACNGAHDFLCEKGYEPELFLTVDPRNTIVANTSRKNDYTTYLISSRCHPELFDHLKDCKVMLWHSWSPNSESEAFKGHMGIGGGTTSGTRAIYVGYILGYRKFSIYGLDSCLAADGKTKRFSGEIAGSTVDIFVGGEHGKKFIANVPMAQQASECQQIMNSLADVSIQFHGNGLLAAIWEERKARGLRT